MGRLTRKLAVLAMALGVVASPAEAATGAASHWEHPTPATAPRRPHRRPVTVGTPPASRWGTDQGRLPGRQDRRAGRLRSRRTRRSASGRPADQRERWHQRPSRRAGHRRHGERPRDCRAARAPTRRAAQGRLPARLEHLRCRAGSRLRREGDRDRLLPHRWRGPARHPRERHPLRLRHQHRRPPGNHGRLEFIADNPSATKWVTVVADYAWGWDQEKWFAADGRGPGMTGRQLHSRAAGHERLPRLPARGAPRRGRGVFFANFGTDFLAFIRDLKAIRPDIEDRRQLCAAGPEHRRAR